MNGNLLGGKGMDALKALQDKQKPQEDTDDASEASDGCGRSCTRGMYAGVIIEMPNGSFEGVYYGAVLGRVRYNPPRGISFIFEDAEGFWKVEILGNNLHVLHRELTLQRREAIHCKGESVSDITITAWTPPKEKKQGS